MQFLVKYNNKSGATMLELAIMMAIMSLWITSVLSVMMSTWSFAKDTEDNIRATNLAREWIEWVINWRNTNWLRFSSDKTNCWMVVNYNSSCIGGGNTNTTISSGSYLLYEKNGAWFLSGSISLDNNWWNWSAYSQSYRVFLWSNGFFTQTGVTNTKLCSSGQLTNCLTQFSREIQLNIINSWSMNIASIVRWRGQKNHELKLQSTITNWKSKF